MESDKPNDRLKRSREKAGFGSAAEFAKRYDLTESTYRSHENGTRELTMGAAKQYGRLLGIPWGDLLALEQSKPSGSPTIKQHLSGTSTRSIPSRHIGDTNVSPEDTLRVLGMCEGGPDGWNLFNGEVVQYIKRPDNLAGVPNAYAVFVSGHSMEPRYWPGELVHVHPGKPIGPGNYVLVQRKPAQEGDPPLAVVKRLVKRTASKVVLEQHNPSKHIEVPASEVVSIHRVVGSSEG